MFRSIAVLALVAGLTAPALAQDAVRTERVYFARGTSSAALAGTLRGDATVDYVVGAREGQTMTVSLRASNASAYFNVLPPGSEGEAIDGAANTTRWSGVLPASGDFKVRVYLMRNAARRGETANYTLNIGVR